jgi:putative peptidoglycan lipid II flippase
MAPAGLISLLNLAQQIINSCVQVAQKSYIVPSIRILANIYKDEPSKYKSTFYFRCIILAAILMLGFTFVHAFPSVFYYAFYFSDELKSVHLQLLNMFFLLFGVLFSNCIASLVNSSFYTHGDTKTPSLISSAIYTVYMPLKVIAFYYGGVKMMVLSTSIYTIFNLLVLLFSNQKLVLNARY